jgi:hypothetical protein
MEPPAAVADVKADSAEIWAPVQSAVGTHEDTAKILGLPMDNRDDTDTDSETERRRSHGLPDRCAGTHRLG